MVERPSFQKAVLVVRLEDITAIRAPVERCFDLARSVEVHLAGNVHFGEQAVVSRGVGSGLIGLGQSVTWRAKHFGLWHSLTSEMTAMEPPLYFQDAMVQGPFHFMRHDHYFRLLPSGATEMKDVFCFASPFGPFGAVADLLVLRSYMKGLLQERNRVIKQIAESSEWRKYLPRVPGSHEERGDVSKCGS